VIGGDVYASAALRSFIPSVASPRYFVRTPTEGTSGVVTYGTSYDFASGTTAQGEAYVSSSQWLANDTYTATDYYAMMYHRFGSPTADYTGDTIFNSELASSADAYFVDGNLTVSGPTAWSVTDGENIVVLVDGDLTINQDITLSGTGFVSFIVNGDITVASAVGADCTPTCGSTPVVEGIYITSPTGTFNTGTSGDPTGERFVGEGIFIAGDFNLQRDLSSLGQNNLASAELFIYNPQLLVTMPDEMRDLPVTWQEVAP
jgi:hypothetical protein